LGDQALGRVDVLVLSACETGLGDRVELEGVIGLQRAAHVAGVRTTIATLWQVPDEATRALMVRFHENLWGCERKDGGAPVAIAPMGRAEALREAQLWIIDNAKDNPDWVRGRRGGLEVPGLRWRPGDPVPPYAWAAFILSGDWR
jgi:CHAT domain-containing protein